MTEYEEISKEYRFGRVKKKYWHKYVQKKVKALTAYLLKEHDLEIEGVYLENYRSPEPILVMNGSLPLNEIEAEFGSSSTFEIKNKRIYSTNPWITIEGAQNDI